MAVCCLVGPSRGGVEGIERSPDFVRDVNRAIDHGSKWLLDQQRGDGGWELYPSYRCATTAMAYYTLRVCGVPRKSPEMVRAYDRLRAEYETAKKARDRRTYAMALVMLAIEEHATEDVRATTKKSRYASQKKRQVKLDKPDLAWMRELVAWMAANQSESGSWRYGKPRDAYERQRSTGYDHSNMQYALLGLKAASRSGVKVSTQVYRAALEHLLEGQQQDGPTVKRKAALRKGETGVRHSDKARGWGYFLDNPPYGSMTTGGVSSVVICRSELLGRRGYSRQADARAKRSIRDGIAWLGENFSVKENPGGRGWHYYYLYGLERAGRLAGVDWMGDHDWYGEGARYLVKAQYKDGFWQDAGPRLVTTCWALLFLRRGTKTVPRGAISRTPDEHGINFGVVSSLSGSDFEDFVDLVLARWRRLGETGAREELEQLTVRVGPKIVLPLLRRMDSSSERKRVAAHALLARATGQTFAFDPAGPAAERNRDLARWEEWCVVNLSRLRYDRRTGTLTPRR